MRYEGKRNRTVRSIAWSMTFFMIAGMAPVLAQESAASRGFHQAIFIDALGQELTSSHYAEKGMEKIMRADFNAIFVQGRYFGEVFYNSIIEPRSSRIDPIYPDPLYDIIHKAHSNSMNKSIKVFAWLDILPCHSGIISAIPPIGNIMQRRPDWLMENDKGGKMDHDKMFYIDPGIPDAQNYIVTMITEVVHKYNVDGILLDNIRYPDDGLNWGYNPLSLAEYYRDTGLTERPLTYDPRFCDWRRAQLTSLMEKIREKVKSIKPDAQIFIGGIAWSSPDSWGWDFKNSPAYSLVFQDWLGWMEKGLVDGVVVHTYKQAPQQTPEFNQWLEYLVTQKGKGKILCSIGGFFNFTQAIISQIKSVRVKELDGVALYCQRIPSKDSPELLFQILPTTAFSPKLFRIPKSGITYAPIEKVTPTPEEPTTPTLSMSVASTETLLLTPTPSPTPMEYVTLPITAGLPSLPNLAELITPTPVVTPIAPTPTKVVEKTTPFGEPPAISERTPSPSDKPDVKTPTPLPDILYATKQWDNIYLKNGSAIKGKIIEEVEGKATIETSKGFIMTLPVADIEKVVQYR
ncbi:family 10 glycosylhydrolase [Candidatus Sumerlaeota bacterium]|nr:family 10 glycosylhydrolase [Candidatus Sumerlaeota bacterium]